MHRPMSDRTTTTFHALSALMLVSVSLLFLGSCGKESGCNVFGSENYDPDAVIDDGSCIEVRDKFIGNYGVNSDCFAAAYLRTISETSDRFIVEVSNIGDTLGTVTALVSGPNITIEQQTVRNNVTVEGAGVYDSIYDNLNLSYRIRDNRSGSQVITNCLEVCVKN